MLTKYIEEAMRRAEYEIMEDGDYFASIPGFAGLWGAGKNLEDCRRLLKSHLEGWLILKLWHHDDDIPVLGRLNLYPRRVRSLSSDEAPLTTRARKAS